MSTITRSFNAVDAPQVMSRVIDALGDDETARVILEECYPVAIQGIRDNFTSSASPDGSDWPARKNLGDGHPLLIESGDLLQAATGGGAGHIAEYQSGTLAVGVRGSAVPHASIHNEGGSKMPQREFAGMSEERIDQCIDIMADILLEAVL